MRDVRFFKAKTIFSVTRLSVFFLFSIFLGGIFVAHTVHAQQIVQNLNSVGDAAGIGTSASLGTIIARILRIFFGILGAVALVLCIYAGFKWMTAAGDEKKVEDAKNILKNGVIGLVIIFAAFGISEFVMTKLFGATGLNTGVGTFQDTGSDGGLLVGYSGASAMGTVIQWHDPVRDATNVSRASIIQVKFKFPIDIASVIDTGSKDVQMKDGAVMSGPLKAGAVLIYPTALGETGALKPNEVWVTLVQDDTNTTFVFDPVPFLGSASQNTPYTVKLSTDIKRQQPSGASAFSSFSGGYSWQFTVGTQIDLTPPKLISIIPVADGTYDRNITVQLTFSEPLNLASAVGLFDPAKKKSFDNVAARDASQNVIPGSWKAGDGFNVIEFTTLSECATNSCGQKVFCLPAKTLVEIRAKSAILLKNADGKIENAQLDPKFGYSGVADTSNNALDGGGKNAATPWTGTTGGAPQGTPQDDFFMNFTTTDAVKSSAPAVVALEPQYYASSKSDPTLDVKSPVSATFDSVMKATTFDDIALNAKNPKAQAGFWKSGANIKITINKVEQTVTKLTVDHVAFAKNSAYAVSIPSTVQDIYQNCFLPAGGLQCNPDPTQGTYSCCNGVAAGETCDKLNYGAK